MKPQILRMTRMGRACQRHVGEPIQPVAGLRNRFFICAIRVIRSFPFEIRIQTSVRARLGRSQTENPFHLRLEIDQLKRLAEVIRGPEPGGLRL